MRCCLNILKLKKDISYFSIKLKLMLSFSAILVLISAFIYTYYPAQQKKQALATLENKVHSMAQMVALGVGIGLELGDMNAVSEAIEWAKRDSGLCYIALLDSAQQPFAI